MFFLFSAPKTVFYIFILNNRTEGGCVSHIKPEHLLDLNEFKCWFELESRKQRNTEERTGYKKNEIELHDSPPVPIKLFNLVSKKAWLDCLLQLLKVDPYFFILKIFILSYQCYFNLRYAY